MDYYQNVMSEHYERCIELLKHLEIPTRSEAIKVLGGPLADVVFKECQPRELREAFGLEPPLEGPGPELWVSPSDLLIGKVVLKPPLTQKYIQALTHQGILKIGAVIEEKYFNKLENDKQDCLEKQDKFLRKMFALILAQEIEKTRREEQDKCEEQLNLLTKYYDDYIQELIDHMEEKLQTLIDEYAEANAEQSEAFENQMKAETERITRELTEDFLNKLQEQETILVRIFTRQLEENEMKYKCAMDFERVKCKENLIQLKHSLECKNISNLMYVLCRERRKCKAEKAAIEKEYEKEIKELNEDMENKAMQIEELEEVRARKKREVDTRERCLVEILRQYQKFINYALRAAPTQAEFLLNIDRMMTFEIDDYCVENEDKAGSKIGSEDEAGIGKGTEVVYEDKEVEVKVNDLEGTLPSSSHQEERREPSDVLPAIYLNDKMYVREDFRDRFSNKIDINPSHELWNQDVEELMKIFRESVGKDKEHGGDSPNKTPSVSFFSFVHFNKSAPAPLQSEAPVIVEEVPIPSEVEIIEEEIEVSETEVLQEQTDNLSYKLKSKGSIETVMSKTSARKSSATDSFRRSKILSTTSLKKSINSNTSAGSYEFKNKARSLLAVTDSLDVIREKRSSLLEHHEHVPGKTRTKSLVAQSHIESSSFKSITSKRVSITMSPNTFLPDLLGKKPISETHLVETRDSLEFQHESVRRHSQVESDDIQQVVQDKKEDALQAIAESAESKLAEVHDSLEKIRTTILNSNIAIHVSSEMEEPPLEKTKLSVLETGRLAPGTGRKSIVGFIPKVIEMKPESEVKLIGVGSKTMAIPRQGPEFEARSCRKCKVVGDPNALEGVQDAQEFTRVRVHEFVDLIKECPSLIRLFTS